MRNNKFLIGLSMGIVGCKLYDCFKEVLKPELVKVVGNAIEIGANTKNFFTEVTEKAQVLNKESYKKINYSNIKENEPYLPEKISDLQNQLIQVQKQLSKL